MEDYKPSMNRAIILVVCLLTAGVYAQSHYLYNFDTNSRYIPSYALGYLTAGTVLTINLNTPSNNGPNAFTMGSLSVIIAQDIYPSSPISCTGSCSSNASCSATCQILLSQNYRLNLTRPSSPAPTNGLNPNVLQHFQVSVMSLPLNTTNSTLLLQVTETFRDRVAKLIYLSSYYYGQFSLYPAAETGLNVVDLTKTNLHLYKVNSITGGNNVYDIKNQPDILTNPALATQTYSSSTRTLSYNTTAPLSKGYYVLVVTYTLTNAHYLKLTYPTDTYPCPYPAGYSDYFLNFQGCTLPAPPKIEPGFPCLAYDYTSSVCLSCATTYSLVNGSCIVLNMCAPRQYFHFGTCFAVSDQCDAYNMYTGDCQSCINPKARLVDGKCIVDSIVCGNRQYKLNNTCVDISPLCESFNSSTGECFSCTPGAILSNLTCTQPSITCQPNYYLLNSTCYPIPSSCAKFNHMTLNCQICSLHYYLSSSNQCFPIVCPERYYLPKESNNCRQIAQACDRFDSISGDCLSCKYSGYTIIDGKCLQVISPLVGCQEREKLGFGPCGDAVINCDEYNLITGNCEKCALGYYLDYTGKCLLKDRSCRDDQVSIQGICVQRPSNCLIVNDIGLCSLCNGTQYQLQDGQCIFSKQCLPDQFLYNGNCVYVTPGCDIFNPTSGQCLVCKDGRSARDGLCCPPGQVGYKIQCVDQQFVAQNFLIVDNRQNAVAQCMAFHPVLGYCLQCNSNYQVNPQNTMQCI